VLKTAPGGQRRLRLTFIPGPNRTIHFLHFYSIYIVIPGFLSGVFSFAAQKIPKKNFGKNRVERADNPAAYLNA